MASRFAVRVVRWFSEINARPFPAAKHTLCRRTRSRFRDARDRIIRRGGARLAMDGFVATYSNRLDAKGRVSVPAPFRVALARDGSEGLYCYPALDQPAIDAGGVSLESAIAERLGVFEPFQKIMKPFRRLFTAKAGF